jgi:hypothetical protein
VGSESGDRVRGFVLGARSPVLLSGLTGPSAISLDRFERNASVHW